MITFDKIIDAKETKTIPKNVICETLLAFLLVTIALLIAVSFYCSLIKCKAKRKPLLPFYVTNNELKKKFCINNIL